MVSFAFLLFTVSAICLPYPEEAMAEIRYEIDPCLFMSLMGGGNCKQEVCKCGTIKINTQNSGKKI